MDFISTEFTPKRIAVKLKALAERQIKKGHPWVFDQSIKKISSDPQDGDIAIIFDQRKNQFLACGIYDAHSPIRIKILQVHTPAKIDSNWFNDKIKDAYNLRLSLISSDTNAYRLVFGENDFLPGIIIDVYNSVAVLKLYSTCWINYLPWILNAVKQINGISTLVLRLSRLVQDRQTKFLDGQILLGELTDSNVEFIEHGVKFRANVIKGHKTGFFLDHRHNRKRIQELALNKKVLDVFSYAGGFSVHALVGGAKKVISLDISPHALELAKENARINDIYKGHEILCGDAFELLTQLTESNKKFDLIIIDPPSFAKQKDEIEGAKHQYSRLASLGAKLIEDGGILLLASCSSRITKEEFHDICERALDKTNRSFYLLEQTQHDIDHPIRFPEGAYLKTAYYQF